MKFPNGEQIKCWYCGYSFKSNNEQNEIICPECGKTLKIFKTTRKSKK